MLVLDILNEKGGNSKTTTVANLTPALARHGWRVGCRALDAQGDLQAAFGIDDDADVVRLEDLLDDPHRRADEALIDITPARCSGQAFMLPSGPALARFSESLHPTDLLRIMEQLRPHLDLLIVDTPVNLTTFGDSSLYIADYAVISMVPGWNPGRAVNRLVDKIAQRTNVHGNPVELLGVLFTQTHERRRGYKTYSKMLKETSWPNPFGGEGVPTFTPIVPKRDPEIEEQEAWGQPATVLRPDSVVALAYTAVADEIVERMGLLDSAQSDDAGSDVPRGTSPDDEVRAPSRATEAA